MCPAVGLPRTGQTTCYDTVGGPISCPGTEQDGELRAGKVRGFTNNGDGTIIDNATGLMWEAKCDGPSCGTLHDTDTSYAWDEAFTSHTATLNSTIFAGHSDWRVPNVTELLSLVNRETDLPAAFGAFDACALDCDVTGCSCTESSLYWSSTTVSNDPAVAWSANFLPVTSSLQQRVSNYVRAVRAVD